MPSTQTTSQFIDLTTPLGTGAFAGDPPQPTSLLLDRDGNLLVGLSPDHSGDGAVEEFDMADQQLISTVISSIGTPAGLAFVPPHVMAVAAADWTAAGLTIARTGDGMLHVYRTGTTTDAIPPQAADSVGEIQIGGPDNAANALTIDFGGGSPIPCDGLSFAGVPGTEINSVIVNDSTGSNSYSLSGSQLFINHVPALTLANTQALSLDLGSGSLDLSGAIQTIGSIASSSFTIQRGTIGASLTGSGGLSKTGSDTAALSGSNSYKGGTTVAAGTLVVTSPAALPTGTVLTIGAGGTFAFRPLGRGPVARRQYQITAR